MIHDVRPFSADPTRVYRTLLGAPSGFEQMLIKCRWSKTDGGARVACGGGDRTVTVWEVETGKILYKLGGHKGSVGAVDWHPREPISESERGSCVSRQAGWLIDELLVRV
jgi:Prp8 binding protein